MGAAETPVKAAQKPPEPRKSMRERVDPRIKSLDGIDNAVRVANKDPGRWYVWANERPVATNTQGDASFYTNMARSMGLDPEDGYRVESVEQGGVFAFGALSRKHGDPIVNTYGQTLVSCPMEFKELVDSVGANLQSGQEEADRLEKLLITRRNLHDHMRGIGKPGHFRVEADPEHGQSYEFQRMERG